MAALPNYVSPRQYLECERYTELKSEYDDGAILNMGGSSPEHETITADLLVAMNTLAELQGAGCRGYSSDLRVRIDSLNRCYYPDLAVVCGRMTVDERVKGMRSITNPTLIVEVLSESTEARDRSVKWNVYQNIGSLRVYALVSQDRPRVEVFGRIAGKDSWEYRTIEGLDAPVVLHEIPCELSMAETYRDMEFQTEFRRANGNVNGSEE